MTNNISLNGWWDIIPIFDDTPQANIPSDNWQKAAYLVPSIWTCSLEGVRTKGEKQYRRVALEDLPQNQEELEQNWEFLYDNFNYPKIWTNARRAWVRRNLAISNINPDERLLVRFNGILAQGTLYINGQLCSSHHDPFTPWETDITGMVHDGNNELTVFVEDYERTADGQTLYPSGNGLTAKNCGIWQDVSLLRRSTLQVENVCIHSRVALKQLYIKWTLKNYTDSTKNFDICPEILKWNANGNHEPLMKLESFSVPVPANGTAEYEINVTDVELPLWSPAQPSLCILQTKINNGECHRERFGYREITINGADLCLNGFPIHAFSDWGHKLSMLHHHENWIRQWFRMIKDCNMNHSRLHTHPHPELILNIADEEGIMITGEAGIHGSGRAQASGDARFWENAAEHIRNFVRRDKNHPCLIMWSVENEMRWNGSSSGKNDLMFSKLPELRKLFNKLDPTRPAYHEGDSSLWNEKDQDVLSRHYGKECSGCGWWDKKQPLHSGEMSLYHYSGPNNSCHLGGDKVWSDFRNVNISTALDTKYIVEDGRTMGVCNFGPWNLSCLENYRANEEELNFEYDDYETPGVKPLTVKPFSSEFAFWQNGDAKGYHPSPSFAIQREGFRQFALIDTNRCCSVYGGTELKRTIHCVNDLEQTIEGILEVFLADESGRIAIHQQFQIKVEQGKTEKVDVAFQLPEVNTTTPCNYIFEFHQGAAILDRQERKLFIGSHIIVPGFTSKIKIFGNGKFDQIWERIGIKPNYINQVTPDVLQGTDILIIDPYQLGTSDLDANIVLRNFCLQGGRCLLLEQEHSIIPSCPLENIQLQKVHIRHRKHPVLSSINEEELMFWGDDPYSRMDGNTALATNSYRKDNGNTVSILDGGDGTFGNGSMEYSQLLEIPLEAGTLLATQLRIHQKLHFIPAAEKLLVNMLQYLDTYSIPQNVNIVEAASVEKAVETVCSGGKAIFTCHTENDVKYLNARLGLNLEIVELDTIYQAVKKQPSNELLCGINNEDACGIMNWIYAPAHDNIPIGKYFIKATDKLDSLLVTPTQSVLKEMYVKRGCTEPLRSHTLSRFLFNEQPEELIVTGIIEVGDGTLILNQFEPESSLPRFKRLLAMLKRNLGASFISTALDGKNVIEDRSKGYPEKIQEHVSLPEPDMLQTMIGATVFQTERMCNLAILNYGNWQEQSSPDGEFSANSDEPRLLFFFIESLKDRKEYDEDLAVPNPEAMTFFELTGSGKLTIFINSIKVQTCTLSPNDSVSIGDIYLNQGFNNVLMLWIPETKSDKLQIRMRNIMRNPETGLIFHA